MFLFGKKADIDIELSNDAGRKVVKSLNDNKEYLVYYDGETISGKINVNVRQGKKLDHQGILIELIGRIEFMYERGSNYEFLNLEKDLARAGILNAGHVSYPFEFKNVRKQYETYRGVNVNLRYFLRIHVIQRLTNMTKELEFEVHTLSKYQESEEPIRMEVGIEDSLHIEFEYNNIKYHLEDVIIGKIYFILVRVKIKHMDIQIIRHEMVGKGPSLYAESTYLNKYEIMDGAPVRGECIPVRLFLKDIKELRPTMQDVANFFSVRYFLNLVLTDEDDRRYYKQQEFFLYRKSDKKHDSIAGSSVVVQSLIQQGQLKNFILPNKPPDLIETNKEKINEDSCEKFDNSNNYGISGSMEYSDESSVSSNKSPDLMGNFESH